MLDTESTSHAIGKEPCPKCGSRDNLARYSDGHGYCFGCRYYEKGDGFVSDSLKAPVELKGEAEAILDRKLSETTCQLWRYHVGEHNGRPANFAHYLDPTTKQVIATKVRYTDKKDFTVLGDLAKAGLYGEWLWRDSGKMIVVTEGEIDALSVSQAQGNKWPVVSLPNGAAGAKKAIQKSYEFLSKFDAIILMFDEDAPGKKAAQECAELFPPGKVKIASLPFKDANETLTKGKSSQIVDAVWGAKTYRPDGIVDSNDLWNILQYTVDPPAIGFPWESMNEYLKLRTSTLVTVTAGSGIGKSSFVKEIAYHLLNQGEKVGMIMLEESVYRTGLSMIGLAVNKKADEKSDLTDEELTQGYHSVFGKDQLYLYDHFGSTSVDNLLSRIRYMAKALECRWIILDHLSIVVSGLDEGNDERKLIDLAMTLLRTLVQETDIGLILVSHLRRPEGKGHEEGARVSLAQLRGSAAIGQLSDAVIGLERDQQGDNPDTVVVRILKNRLNGKTGEAAQLHYNSETGRLSETPKLDGDY